MTIDRRDFVTGVALTAVAPALSLLPASPPIDSAELNPLIMMIEGWSIDEGDEAADRVWIRLDRSWRAAWR